MGLVIPVDHYQVSFLFSLLNDPEPIVITFGVTGDEVDLNAQFTALATAFGANFEPLLGFHYTLYQINVIKGGAAPPYDTMEIPLTTPIGFSGGNSCPQNCAILVKKRSGTPGRRNQGRFFLPGVPEEQVSSNGVLAPTWRASMQAAADAFLDAIADEFVGMVIHHLEGSPSEEPTAVQNLLVDTVISTQRRRLR